MVESFEGKYVYGGFEIHATLMSFTVVLSFPAKERSGCRSGLFALLSRAVVKMTRVAEMS